MQSSGSMTRKIVPSRKTSVGQTFTQPVCSHRMRNPVIAKVMTVYFASSSRTRAALVRRAGWSGNRAP
ncbi:MAG: hypothetical protein EPO43_10770 [Rugosibacter sp.]|nr:MAG: hypothetical protein EPO43_10770 [Rugosibacter sp.]